MKKRIAVWVKPSFWDSYPSNEDREKDKETFLNAWDEIGECPDAITFEIPFGMTDECALLVLDGMAFRQDWCEADDNLSFIVER